MSEPSSGGLGVTLGEVTEGLTKVSEDVARREVASLSARYRQGPHVNASAGLSASTVEAYAIARQPATYAAANAVLGELAQVVSGFAPRSIVDIGAGTGACTWAALERFPTIERADCIEREATMLEFGRRVLQAAPISQDIAIRWGHRDVLEGSIPEADLVVGSYVLGELTDGDLAALAQSAWAATRAALVLIEPGTPRGHRTIRRAADLLLSDDSAHPVAPCPHGRRCPLTDEDWCHFSARLPRSRIHRAAKEARLGHEDEKFSYFVVGRSAVQLPAFRVIRNPQFRKGHARVTVCSADDEVHESVITKRDRSALRVIRKSGWGAAVFQDDLGAHRP